MTDISGENDHNAGQKWGNFDRLKEKWPSPFVSRDHIAEFTEGMFKQSSMSTLDARGTGIQKRYRIGNRVFYETDTVIDWLKTKVK
jgi:hypothetical protein